MSEQRPTREQWLAVNVLDRDIAVTAGAGSGKTWVLTRRYVTQIAGRQIVPDPIQEGSAAPLPRIVYPEPVSPEQIVAITFTEKAAAEMKERIRGELERLYHDAPENERGKWLQSMDDIESSIITTIHGLCARLIRQYPLQAQINPRFVVVEPHEADALFDEAVDAVITRGLQSDDSLIIRLLQEYPMYTLRQAIRTLYDQLREMIDPIAWDQIIPYTLDRIEEQRQLAMEEAQRLVRAGDQVDLSRPEKSKGKFELVMAEAFHPYWSAWREKLAQSKGVWDDELREIATLLLQACKGRVPKSYEETVSNLIEQIKLWAGYMCSESYTELVQAVVHLLQGIDQAYLMLKRKQHALDFTDMQIAALRLLEDPIIRQKVTHSIRYVMVDEFQDTNHMQARLVRHLAEQAKLFIVGDAKQSIYAFRQADVGVFLQLQQEIQTSRKGQKIELQHNFRTVSPIITFVNRFFGELMKPSNLQEESASSDRETYSSDTAAYRVAYDGGMIATRNTPDEQPRVEWIHIPLDEQQETGNDGNPATESVGEDTDARKTQAGASQQLSGSMQTRLQEAESIAKRIRLLCETEKWIVEADSETGKAVNRSVRYGDITLLFSAMTHVRFYEFMLQKYNIPYYVVGGRNFYKRQEIIDVLHVLRVVLNPQDELSLVGVLRSPLFSISDEGLYWLAKDKGFKRLLSTIEEQLWDRLSTSDQEHILRFQSQIKRWREYAVFAPVGEVLDRIYEDTGILQIVLTQFGGRQKLGNLQKLLRIAYTYQDEKQYSLPDFVAFLSKMVEQEIDETDADVTSLDEDVVKIMTIHQSKGLEFPIVILPDLARQPRSDSVTFLYHPQTGLGLKVKLSEKSTGSGEKAIPLDGSGIIKDLQKEVSDRSKQEERRKLYVAMTRARDYLILVGSKKSLSSDRGKALHGANWLEWLAAIVNQEQQTDLSAACESFGVQYVTPELLEEKWSDYQFEREGTHSTGTESLTTYRELEFSSDTFFQKEVALQVPLTLREDAASRIHSVPHAYLTATMVVDQIENPIRFKRRYEMGLPDWKEWDVNDSNHAFQSYEAKEEPSLSADTLGTIVHKVCELLTEKEQAKEITQQVLIEFGLPHEENSVEFKSVWQLVERYSNSDIFREIYTASSIQSEVPFRVVLDGQEYTGMIDKLITDSIGNVTVIDFKTNHVTADNRVHLEAKYQPQLDLYKKAMETILKRPVHTKLVFVRDL